MVGRIGYWSICHFTHTDERDANWLAACNGMSNSDTLQTEWITLAKRQNIIIIVIVTNIILYFILTKPMTLGNDDTRLYQLIHTIRSSTGQRYETIKQAYMQCKHLNYGMSIRSNLYCIFTESLLFSLFEFNEMTKMISSINTIVYI